MKILPVSGFFVLCSLFQLNAQDAHPGVEKFAKDITNVIWDLRGTSSLKHLRYDGESVRSLNSRDQARGPYDSAFVDVGVMRLNYRGSYTGWYFFSDDLKWVTPIRAAGEIAFKLADGSVAKPVAKFPENIQNLVWESEPDERKLDPLKIRWNGEALEFGVKKGGEWEVERVSAVVAERRVLEITLPDKTVVWLAFSADGKEAWFLQTAGIYGGHARAVSKKASATAAQTGLKPYLADLTNHAEDLKSAGEKMRAATLRRYLLRMLSGQPEQAKHINQRLGDVR